MLESENCRVPKVNIDCLSSALTPSANNSFNNILLFESYKRILGQSFLRKYAKQCCIICFAIVGNLVVAGVSGLLIPIVLHKLHIDPALSSSIFLTTATDVLGFFIFLSLAKLFLPFLT